jgi:peptidoglycan/xylan/chitin deacetylase (PgdA/CDA1 family)
MAAIRSIGLVVASLLTLTACGSPPGAPAPLAGRAIATAVPGASRAATSAPAVVARPGGGYEVFYRGWNGTVFDRTLVDGTWSTPTALDGTVVGAPAAASIGADVVLVVRGPYNGLNLRIRTGGHWSAWRSLGRTVTAPPAVTASSDGRVDVFVRGQDDRLYTRTLKRATPTTSWRALSAGPVATGPAATATGAGRITVLVTGGDHSVLRRTLTGGVWSGWSSLGGRTYFAPAVASVPGTSRVLGVVRGTGDQLWSRELPGGAWTARGGLLIDAPAAGARADENLVVVRDRTDRYQSRTVRNGTWAGFRTAWAPAPRPNPPASLLGTDWTRIPTRNKVVALTFDGGANADGFASIRATLQRKNVRATFFLTGDWVRTFPALAAEVAISGFAVGNHSNTHPHFPALTDARVASEVRTAEAAVLRSSGVDPRPLFRFPYGDVNARVLGDVNRLGYVAVRWTIDSLGWKGTSGGMTVQRVIDRVVGGVEPGAIVLMHTGSNPDDHTTLDARALPTIIDRLRAQGYRFVTLHALA